MSENPLNLALRFVMEMVALIAVGYWGWHNHDGALRWLLMLGLPIIAATIWAVFRVPGEPAEAPIAVSGGVRLGIEFALWGAALAGLWAVQQHQLAGLFAVIVILHYVLSYDRLGRLLGVSA